jgi:hypothetical protein
MEYFSRGTEQEPTLIHITDANYPTWLQHAMHLAQGFEWLTDMFKDIMGKECIERFGGKSEFVDVANLEVDIGNAVSCRPLPGTRDFDL